MNELIIQDLFHYTTLSMKPCPACANREHNTFLRVREMMLGTRNTFTYIHCQKCYCLYLNDLPSDLGTYYPDTYYSFNYTPGNQFIEWVRKTRDRFAVTNQGALGRFFYLIFPVATMRLLHWAGKSDRTTSILDVGCGNGQELGYLQRLGFNNLHGIDPFIREDILAHQADGLSIYRKNLWEWNGQHDLITFNHSFEHFTVAPEKVLQRVADLLKPGGKCSIRIPVTDCYAFTQYNTNWVQIDAPRHYFIPSVQTIHQLARRVGLTVESIHYDSTMLQFIGSEQYKHDIALQESRSFYSPLPGPKFISWPQAIQYWWKAKRLNKNRQGDQAVFILAK
ncbi:class I SAM-dependent methyltransferase [Spirosoma lituiforme]